MILIEIVAAVWIAWFSSHSMMATEEILKRLSKNESEILEALEDIREIKLILKTPRYRKTDSNDQPLH